MDKKYWKKLPLKDAPGGFLVELLAATVREKNEGTSTKGNDNFSTMPISDLRKKLHDQGLDMDGSIKTLIDILK